MLNFKIQPVTQFQQNCSLLICEQSNKAAIVDPGGDFDILVNWIDSLNIELEQVLLTHGHIDHVGAVTDIAQHYNIPIVGPHKDEIFWLDKLPMQASMFGFKQAEPFVPNQWLEHGDKVIVGVESLQVLFTPGHTPGHIVFYSDVSKIVVVGDVLFQGSIGRTDFPKGDQDQLILSIKQHLLSLEDDVKVLPGHGDITTIGYERLNNPFLK